MSDGTVRAAAYVRAPVYARGYEQHSVNEQRERIERYVGEREWQLTNTYEDAVRPPGEPEERSALAAALANAGSYDKLVVTRLDRLATSPGRAAELIEELGRQGVGVAAIDEDLDTATEAGSAVPKLLALAARWSRSSAGKDEDARGEDPPFQPRPLHHERVELLSDPVPYSAELLERLGLRGLHCGCGKVFVAGWVNSDLRAVKDGSGNATERGRIALLDGEHYYLEQDATEEFPFADACFEWAYSEHFIEHVPMGAGVRWLREMRRVLKPGGVLRITTPNLARYVDGYLEDDGAFFAEHRRRLKNTGVFEEKDLPDRRAWMVNQIFYGWGHRWVYDPDEIRHIAAKAGFDPESVAECSFREGHFPEVAALDREQHNDESLYVEITRPAFA